MGTIIDSKESRIAQKLLLKSKEAFGEKIARNTVKDIDISSGVQDEAYAAAARFLFTGSVETSSPTGKPRTYRYNATIDVVDKEASFVSLEVAPLEG